MAFWGHRIPCFRLQMHAWHELCSSCLTSLGIHGATVVPYHTIAFSQQKLRAALRRSAGQDPALNYGFVVHARRQNDRPTLGVITLNGESLPLNRRLLAGL
jgi:hypothetical protein